MALGGVCGVSERTRRRYLNPDIRTFSFPAVLRGGLK